MSDQVSSADEQVRSSITIAPQNSFAQLRLLLFAARACGLRISRRATLRLLAFLRRIPCSCHTGEVQPSHKVAAAGLRFKQLRIMHIQRIDLSRQRFAELVRQI